MSTPDLYLRTSFVLDSQGRIVSTREPNATSGPLFTVVRSLKSCAWAVRADVPRDLASELERLAQDEPPAADLRQAPVNADRYITLLRDLLGTAELPETKTSQSDGPAFEFPDLLPAVADVVLVEDESPLEHNFQGWKPGEIAAGCAPVLAIVADNHPVSICFCARRSDEAAEAGVETAAEYRG